MALIVPSLCCEVSAQVTIEAFVQRTPVIVRNLGGMPELIEESGGGFVYETDAELLAAMEQLLANRALRDELGQRGYQAYQQKWTPEAHLERYLEMVAQARLSRRDEPSV
jgi:glycosyltransferase involved in cell wall biosynthesis